MSPADIATASRLVIAPVFALIFYLPDEVGWLWRAAALLGLGIAGELTDWLDGYLARRSGTLSDFGKVFDPFADTVMHLTFFIVLCLAGALPLIFLLFILYREFAISLLRQLSVKRGMVMGARGGGKLKTVSYVFTWMLAFANHALGKLGFLPGWRPALTWIVWAFCALSAVLALVSFMDYLIQYRRLPEAS